MRAQRRMSARARFAAALALTAALASATTLVVAGAGASDPGPFTGCLGVKTNKGLVYSVALGATPMTACSKGDLQIAFSNAQGPEGPQGEAGPAGPAGADADASALSATIAALEARIAALEDELPPPPPDCDDGDPTTPDWWDPTLGCTNGLPTDPNDEDGDGIAGDCDDTNPLIHPGAPEIVNGLDDDCDGNLGSWIAAGSDVGACDPGMQSETPDGLLGPVVGAIGPTLEVVDNGIDDDCDFVVDELE